MAQARPAGAANNKGMEQRVRHPMDGDDKRGEGGGTVDGIALHGGHRGAAAVGPVESFTAASMPS